MTPAAWLVEWTDAQSGKRQNGVAYSELGAIEYAGFLRLMKMERVSYQPLYTASQAQEPE